MEQDQHKISPMENTSVYITLEAGKQVLQELKQLNT